MLGHLKRDGGGWMTGMAVAAALLAAGSAIASPAPGAIPAKITPFLGQARDYDCRSVALDQGNVVGFMSIPADEQTVQARVLYRQGNRSATIRLRLMREDAEALRNEVDALLRRLRSAPIRFQATLSRNGECAYSQVTG